MSQPSEPAVERRHVVRVGLGLLVPGVVLLVAGRPELIVYAVFGSFTGMYGRREGPAERLRHQFHGAGMLVTGVALGVTFSQREAPTAALVVGVTLFATVGSLLTDRLRLHPGGPFFGIFAFGATATIGADLVDPFVAVGICVATAAWCLALGLSGLAPGEQPAGVPQEPLLGTLVHALRYAVAIAGAGAVGLALGLDHANWAMAAAAVPLAVVVGGEPLDLRAVLDRAAHRVAGTFAGLAVTAAVLLPEPRPAVLAVVVMVLLFPTELFMSRHYGLALGFFTPLIMLMTELAAPSDPSSLLLARGVDTVVGVVVGVAAAARIPGRRPSGTAQERIAQWAE
ncbi:MULTISPECIES: FUSC family protein [unclassified Nocardioides]|uniref:FUSC family protein n=1 Tax=unclassified Nocardioides TaxID=2615069 RepID=UPI0007033E07|nr:MULTISPECIES: FUSC family protein [unclassified Nocardioides]KRC46523.1 hypothetical protein ASE19_22180 [Nocardioides sp. Root79]KRC69866.1 hypothetical protein ASE20_15030 [Nocardioides sp. Root240]